MNDSILQQKQQIQELLGSAQGIGVVLSQNQTMDKVAAALSIALALQDSGKNSQIVSLKEPIVEYSSLVGIDQIRSSFTGSTKTLTVSFPYKDGEIEKVSYNIEGDRLNVNLFAETNGINFSEKDIRYIRQGSAPSVVITIGVSDPSELGGLVDPATTQVITIDNSASNSQFGNIIINDASSSSLSEMVAKLAEILQLQLEFDVAQNLLDGVMSATQNFTSPKTSPLAFEMAGVLMQKGAVRRMQKPENRHADTSLQMLGKQQGQSFPKQSFQNAPFGNTQDKQDKQFGGQKGGNPGKQFPQSPKPQSFQNVQDKQFGNQNFPKQNPFKKQPVSGNSQFDGNKPQQPRPFPQDFRDAYQDEPQFQSQPQAQEFDQPQESRNMNSMNTDSRMDEIKSQLQNIPTPQIPEEQVEEPQVPTEDQAPSDWFTPKVFKSNKN